jgi:hypothetical protein
MKIYKPVYNPANKVYTCQLADGFRLHLQKEATDPVSSPVITDEFIKSLTTLIIDSTKGWFSKPLTAEWLCPRIKIDIPTTEISNDFDGTADFLAKTLLLSKDEFRFCCVVEKLTPAEKVVIAFDEAEAEEVEAIPEAVGEASEPLGIGPTRRILHKARVMKERSKAAKALFKAERLTQEYIQLYGAESTDWEEDEDDDEQD